MTIQSVEPHATRLLSYVIASADMYYTEMERRDVFLSCNEQGNFCIWGKMADRQPSTTIDVFEIFLEYALYCRSWVGKEEPLYHIQDFGERLGRSIAGQIQNSFLPFVSHNLACQMLRYIFETMDAHPSVENIDAGARVILIDYPLEKAAKCSGLCNIELAHCGIESMCQSLIRCVNPSLVLNTSSDACSEFIFTILTPGCA